ncbi:MAG: tetratricopeptide repeat protein [Iphinoe sp. HA4291-MV1]|jgi:predicted O-linked N-acetylglucosamine transferase (SPINDLY family)|nr:tetratricopeptide repeat protein [Iphinoe sp. HA4291-MV1]
MDEQKLNDLNNQTTKNLDELFQEALESETSGRYKEAESQYKKLFILNKNQTNVLFHLGMLYYATERYQEALELLQKSLELDPSKAVIHFNMAKILEKVRAIPQAIQAYQRAIELAPQWVEPYENLANIFLRNQEFERAEPIYRQATIANSNHLNSYLNLANVLMKRHQFDYAIQIYQKALELKPRDINIITNIGVAFDANQDSAQAALYYGYACYYREQYQNAIDLFDRFLETQVGNVRFYEVLANCYERLHQNEKAIKTFRKGLKLYPKTTQLYLGLASELQGFGESEAAIAVLTEAIQLLPNTLSLEFKKQLILPIIYETQAEIDFYRNRFTIGLNELIQKTSLDNLEAEKDALSALKSSRHNIIQNQGKNDRELQAQYGQFVCQVMAVNYPQWSKPLVMPSLSESPKIRVGYVSSHFTNHHAAKWALGWLRNHNRQEFKTYCYYTGNKIEQTNQKFKFLSDVYHHIPENLSAICEQITADKLHILVFPDIGVSPLSTMIAGLRLAPVQCTAWGNAMTSGLPTVDYFLSSELMEPENAQQHYCEQLVRLPNSGLCYEKPFVPQLTKSRSDFQLRDHAVVYLSCQSLTKYLPQYDYIFAEIVQQVPEAQIVFLSSPCANITEKFQQRLKRAFAKFGMIFSENCLILPRQDPISYMNLNLVSDVFLDTFAWSGGNTTLEAIACNLPIVTCPGELMRGRHSYAFLKMMGVTDTIAKNEAEYIEIAVRLGLDQEWRKSIVEHIKQQNSILYDDKTCVEALDVFFRRIVQSDHNKSQQLTQALP